MQHAEYELDSEPPFVPSEARTKADPNQEHLMDLLARLDSVQLRRFVQEAEKLQSDRQQAQWQAFFASVLEKAQVLGMSRQDLLRGLGRPQSSSLSGETAAPRGPRRSTKPARGRTKSAPVRYRGPQGDTWSGRGRKPTWLAILESHGHEAREFRVEG